MRRLYTNNINRIFDENTKSIGFLTPGGQCDFLPQHSQDLFQVFYIFAFFNIFIVQVLHRNLPAVVTIAGLIVKRGNCICTHDWEECHFAKLVCQTMLLF